MKKYVKEEFGVGALLAPVPSVIVTCGTLESPNAITIAWTGIVCSNPAMTYISVRPERYSYELIKKSGEFVINLTTEELAAATDFIGVRSGRDMDKLKKCGLTAAPSSAVSAPSLLESPVCLECRVSNMLMLGSHHMFLASIEAVCVARELLDENGRLCLEKAGLIAYSHGEYFSLGKKLGSFGYSVKKKKSRR